MANPRWEYKVVQASVSWTGTIKPEQMAEVLNREGQQGWELVNTVLYGMRLHFILKRER
ncbi:DUF4177 domain-containing protein [Dokdonella sp.]|uniref:DUF4177 domain-containing protein n=1 Tax=Dokdonella sp. TaxID=2291710 RepID=UPI0031BCBAA9|nr:DUF4177 domain-containing protein [Dokdonella sp.]